jgi:branched-chain amino acid transport system substrate-binding protein
MKRKLAVLLLAAAILAIGIIVLQRTTRDHDEISAIRVAANFPLSGELAFYGESFRDGLEMAISEHDSGGGPQIIFDWGDNKFTPKDAVSVLQKQLLNNPTIYTSALKPQVMAITDQVTELGIPHFPWILDVQVNPNSSGNNLRPWVSFKLESEVFIAYSRRLKAKRVAMVFLNLPSAEQEYAQIIAPALRQDPGSEVLIERFDSNVAPQDFKGIAAKVAAFKPDIIMINGFIPHMVALIRALRPLGVIQNGNTLAALDMLDAADVVSSEEIEGIIVSAPPFLLDPTEQQLEWVERFREKYNRNPPYHSAFAYDMGLILLDAASRLDYPATKEQWLDALRSTKIDGLTGPLEFDEDGSLITNLEPARYDAGVLVPLRSTGNEK